MKIEYIRNLTGSHMIIKDADYPYENSELLMLLNNQVPGLLELQVIISNGKMEYWYDITGTTSLGTMMELFSLDGHKLRRMIEDIYDMNCQLEEYLLDGQNVAYLPELIYYDRNLEKYRFCYLPGVKTEAGNSIQTLAEYLLTKIDHKDQSAVKMGYAFYEASMQEYCGAEELLGCTSLSVVEEKAVKQEEEQEKEHMIRAETEEDWPITDEDKPVMVKRGRIGKRTLKAKRRRAVGEEKDYAKMLKEMQFNQQIAEPMARETPTVFLKQDKAAEYGKLIYQGEGEEENFVLDQEVFLVGKDADRVNGLLRADTVSRIHARIFQKEGAYYIEDLNSTNGTYVNGKELFYREPVKLKKMDRVFFATEEYLFG